MKNPQDVKDFHGSTLRIHEASRLRDEFAVALAPVLYAEATGDEDKASIADRVWRMADALMLSRARAVNQ